MISLAILQSSMHYSCSIIINYCIVRWHMIIYNSRSFPTIFLANLLKFRNCVWLHFARFFFHNYWFIFFLYTQFIIVWKTKKAKCVVIFFFFWEEAKCVVDFSQSIKNIKGVDKSKRIHDIIVYTCPYLFFLYHGILM